MSDIKNSKKEAILQQIVKLLEQDDRNITVKKIAMELGITESTLYRHFQKNGKTEMFERIIEFIENSTYNAINKISLLEISSVDKIFKLIDFIIGFAAKNPGLCRILSIETINKEIKEGEKEKLIVRINQYFEYIESRLHLFIQEAEMNQEITKVMLKRDTINMISNYIQGSICKFARDYKNSNIVNDWETHKKIIQGFIQSTPKPTDNINTYKI